MQITLQIIFALLWVAGLIVVVVGIYYGLSLLVLGAVSRILPLTGRRRRPRSNEADREHHPREKA